MTKAKQVAPDGAQFVRQPDHDAIRVELQLILDSHVFQSSPRCQKFLKFAVDEALAGRAEALKERTLGVEVFGRDPAYDTNQDSIVRVRANEVRKRLAQYYVESGRDHELRIDVHPGSYVPEFSFVSLDTSLHPAPLPEVVLPARNRFRRRLAILLVAAAAGVAIYWLRTAYPASHSPAVEFWRPFLRHERPVIVCLPQPPAYQFTRKFFDHYMQSHATNVEAGPVTITLEPKVLIPAEDIVLISDLYVGAGDAVAASRFSSFFGEHQKPSMIRVGNDISFADLRTFPAILIGAYSNPWNLQINKELRFFFTRRNTAAGAMLRLEDRQAGQGWEIVNPYPTGKVIEDFLLITRVFEGGNGRPLVSLAGLTMSGTEAASEFLTDGSGLSRALAHAPAGWERMNLQIVLKTKVLGSSPGPPEVLATHFW